MGFKILSWAATVVLGPPARAEPGSARRQNEPIFEARLGLKVKQARAEPARLAMGSVQLTEPSSYVQPEWQFLATLTSPTVLPPCLLTCRGLSWVIAILGFLLFLA